MSKTINLRSSSMETTANFPRVVDVMKTVVQRVDDKPFTLNSVPHFHLLACEKCRLLDF